MIEITVLLQVNSFVFVFKEYFWRLLVSVHDIYKLLDHLSWLLLLNLDFWLLFFFLIGTFFLVFIFFVLFFLAFFSIAFIFIWVSIDSGSVVQYYLCFIENTERFEGLIVRLWWNRDIIFFTLVGYENDVLIVATIESSPEVSASVQGPFKVIFWINVQCSLETMAFSIDRNFNLEPNSESNGLCFVNFNILFQVIFIKF